MYAGIFSNLRRQSLDPAREIPLPSRYPDSTEGEFSSEVKVHPAVGSRRWDFPVGCRVIWRYSVCVRVYMYVYEGSVSTCSF